MLCISYEELKLIFYSLTPTGFGFIGINDGSNLFVHYTAIQGEEYRSLSEGDYVELKS